MIDDRRLRLRRIPGGARLSAAVRAKRRTPVLQVAKSAVATMLAWVTAAAVIPGPPPIFAAIAALLVVQPSLNQTFLKAIERSAGVIIGVVIASTLHALLGGAGWVILLAIVITLLLAWALRVTVGTANQMGISAVLVLALSTGSANYATDRVIETLIGAAIGFVVNIGIVPPVAIEPARASVARFADELAASLDRLSTALTTAAPPMARTELLVQARLLRPMADRSRALIEAAHESLALNPRGRRGREQLASLETTLDRLAPIAIQVTGMTRAFHDYADPALSAEPAVAAIAEQLRRAAHDVRRAAVSAGGVAAGHDDAQPALTAPLTILRPSGDHWILIGSLMEDLRRIHDELGSRPTMAG